MAMSFPIDLSDLKRSCVDRILRETVFADMKSNAKRPGKMPEDMDDEDEEEEEESESEKLASLHSETKGSPAPIPVTEEDFKKGSMRKAMSKVPLEKEPKKRKKKAE